LFAKHQGLNPTGSFKDAGMTVAATFAQLAGFCWVACASTGNTSASMAAYAARGGMRSLVLVPEGKISWSKLSQALDYGAVTCQLRTDFDGCLRLLQELVLRAPVYQLNSINPFRLEGQKTLALELLDAVDVGDDGDVSVDGDEVVVTVAPARFEEVRRTLEERNYKVDTAEVTMNPTTSIPLDASQARQVLRLLDGLEEHEDVQQVYANAEIPDDVLESVG